MVLFNNAHFIKVLKHYRKEAYPILVPYVHKLVEGKFHFEDWSIKVDKRDENKKHTEEELKDEKIVIKDDIRNGWWANRL